MTVTADVQVACEDADVPPAATFQTWVAAAVGQSGRAPAGDTDVAVRIVNADEIRTLNRLYREKDTPTNVLSFPAGDIEGLPPEAPQLLGDVVVCASVVAAEAREQGKIRFTGLSGHAVMARLGLGGGLGVGRLGSI